MTDNEFYVVVFRDKEYGVSNHVFIHLINGEGEEMSAIRNIELLELIAELKMSDSKARQALGQEISRLVHAELDALTAERDKLREAMKNILHCVHTISSIMEVARAALNESE